MTRRWLSARSPPARKRKFTGPLAAYQRYYCTGIGQVWSSTRRSLPPPLVTRVYFWMEMPPSHPIVLDVVNLMRKRDAVRHERDAARKTEGGDRGEGGGTQSEKKCSGWANNPRNQTIHMAVSGIDEHTTCFPSMMLLTDSKSRMPTKLWPRNSHTLLGPNTAVNRLQRIAEAAQYLLGQFKSSPQ